MVTALGALVLLPRPLSLACVTARTRCSEGPLFNAVSWWFCSSCIYVLKTGRLELGAVPAPAAAAARTRCVWRSMWTFNVKLLYSDRSAQCPVVNCSHRLSLLFANKVVNKDRRTSNPTWALFFKFPRERCFGVSSWRVLTECLCRDLSPLLVLRAELRTGPAPAAEVAEGLHGASRTLQVVGSRPTPSAVSWGGACRV